MSARTRASQVVAVLPAVAALLWLAPVWAADDAGDAAVAPEQWIARIPDEVEVAAWSSRLGGLADWVLWPSEDYITARQPPRDRAVDFPPEYQGGDTSRKPVRLGAVTPQMARASAARWLCLVLKPEWLPKGFQERLVLLQEDDPIRSWVACRLEADGTRIQVTQRLWGMCVVVVPAPELVAGVAPAGLGPAVFPAIFTRGEEMVTVQPTELAGLPEGLCGFAGRRATLLWWGWSVWYTDAHAVAVYLPKCDLEQRILQAGDVWF